MNGRNYPTKFPGFRLALHIDHAFNPVR